MRYDTSAKKLTACPLDLPHGTLKNKVMKRT